MLRGTDYIKMIWKTIVLKNFGRCMKDVSVINASCILITILDI